MQTMLDIYDDVIGSDDADIAVWQEELSGVLYDYALEMSKPHPHHPREVAAEFSSVINGASRTPMAGRPSKEDLERVVPLTEGTFDAWGAGDGPTRERIRLFLVTVAVHWLQLRSRHGECVDEELAMKAGEKAEESLQKKVAAKEITFMGVDEFYALAARKIRWEFIDLARVRPDRYLAAASNEADGETLPDILDSIASPSASPAEAFKEEAKREQYVRAVANFFSRWLSLIAEDTQRLVRHTAHRETLDALVLYVKSALVRCVPRAEQQAASASDGSDLATQPVERLVQRASFDELADLLLKKDQLCFDHREVSNWVRAYLGISQAAWNQRVKRLRQMFLLSESDMLNGMALCAQLDTAGKAPPDTPLRRLWELLLDTVKETIRRVVRDGSLSHGDKKIILEELNRLLVETNPGDEPCLAHGAGTAATTPTINSQGQVSAGFQTQARNRRLIERACPESIAVGPDFRPCLLDWLSGLGLLGRPSAKEEFDL
jgi:hypothetical protein